MPSGQASGRLGRRARPSLCPYSRRPCWCSHRLSSPDTATVNSTPAWCWHPCDGGARGVAVGGRPAVGTRSLRRANPRLRAAGHRGHRAHPRSTSSRRRDPGTTQTSRSHMFHADYAAVARFLSDTASPALAKGHSLRNLIFRVVAFPISHSRVINGSIREAVELFPMAWLHPTPRSLRGRQVHISGMLPPTTPRWPSNGSSSRSSSTTTAPTSLTPNGRVESTNCSWPV